MKPSPPLNARPCWADERKLTGGRKAEKNTENQETPQNDEENPER
jgi:hypothetical protein